MAALRPVAVGATVTEAVIPVMAIGELEASDHPITTCADTWEERRTNRATTCEITAGILGEDQRRVLEY